MHGAGSVIAIVAALNEEEGIGPTIEELRRCVEDLRVLVVDGNSTDRTVEIAKNLGANVIFQEGRGKGDAVACAVRAVSSEAKYAVFTDADYTYPADYLPRMLQILDNKPNVGMVCGNRFNSKFGLRRALNNSYYLGNRMLAFTHNLMNGVNLRDPLTGLRVVRWEILRGWTPRSKGFDIEVEMNRLVETNGFTIVEIPIHYRQRLGEKKLKLRHGFTILKRVISETIAENF